MYLNAIIIEDDPNLLETLKILINQYCQSIRIIEQCTSIDESIVKILQLKPDLVFLDIELSDGISLEIFEKIPNPNFDIIFTTAHDHYAIKAIKLNTTDYLLKPINPKDLVLAVDKVITKRQRSEEQIANKRTDKNYLKKSTKIAISTLEDIEFIEINDIIYCKANGAYTEIICNDRKLLSSKNLKEFETLLKNHNFIRTHHSYLVNLNNIRKYIKANGGSILMTNNQQVSVSARKKDALLKALTNF